MNMYFIDIFEKIKFNQFNDDSFVPNECYWELAKSWYLKYSVSEIISDKDLLDLLYFFYIHENLDLYDNVRFSQVTEPVCKKYNVNRSSLLKMFSDFHRLVYEM